MKLTIQILSAALKLCGAAVLFLACQSIARSGDSLDADTPLYHTERPVRVVAEKPKQIISLSTSPIFTINREMIRDLGTVDISDAIKMAPGTFILDYGGASAMKTVSIRGATSQQTLVMLDGFALNSNQTGSIDLSFLPISMFDEIDVVRGGSSALNGSNAIAGAINLSTKVGNKESYDAYAEYGSFNTMKYRAGTTQRFGQLGISANAEYMNSDGDFPYTVGPDNEEFRRKNADIKRLSANLYGDYVMDEAALTARFIYSEAERGVPGAIIGGSSQTEAARYGTKDLLFIGNYKESIKREESKSNLTAGLMYLRNQSVYDDPLAFGYGIRNEYESNDIKMKFGFDHKWGIETKDKNLHFLLELGHADLEGDMLDPTLNRNVERSNFALAGLYEMDLFRFNENSWTAVNAALRYDHYFDEESALSPAIGLQYFYDHFNENRPGLKVNAEWSYNFRMPGFNEMYYLNYGNSDLKPERSHSLNFGSEFIPFYDSFFDCILSANVFMINTYDQIVSVPKSPVSWSAENIGEVLTQGIELNLSVNGVEKKIVTGYLYMSYSYQVAEDRTIGSPTFGKKVPYIPNEIFSVSYVGSLGNIIFVGAKFSKISHRYALSDNSYDSMLPKYTVLNIFWAYTLKIDESDIKLRFDIYNSENREYEIIKNYPMPGGNIKFSLNANL
jgi:vitamin B12 transporter